MAIGRRKVLAGGAALWVGAPAILRAQTSSKIHVGHGIAMHGEPKYGADPGPLDFLNPAAPKTGAVKFGTLGTYDSLHPFTLKGVPAAGLGSLWETLCWHSPEEAFTAYGLIAETIEWPEDRSWVAFTLRAQAKWHDGTAITPEDVVFSFDILKSKGRPTYAAYYADVIKAEKTGDAKVLFTFRNDKNRELPLILGQLPILPSTWWKGKDFEKVSLEPALGSGPYKVDSVDVGRSITYRRVPTWWARDLWFNRGRNNFETIRYDYYRDNTIIFEAFKGGDTDIRRENSGRNWMIGYKDLPAIADGRIQRAEIAHENPAPMQGFVFNTRRDIFKHRNVREAIGLMYDFEWQNKNLSYGFYQRTRSYFGNCELEAKGLPSPEELKILEPLRGKIPDEVFTAEYNPPKTDGSGNIREQVRKAIPLLKEAGWEIKDGKMTDKNGRKLAFEILLNDAAFEKMALPVKQNLERLGIDMTIRTVDTSQYQRRTDNYDFDMVIDLWAESLSPGNEQRDFWGSKAADIPGGRNTIGIKDPAIDQLVELIIAAPDRESLVTRTRALDRVLSWHMFAIPQFYSGKALVAYWNRFGRPSKTAKYEPLAFDTWWVDEAKDRALTRGEKK
ncbi:microcin C transport system substrate-binding protein [Enhydrobacter aerosaccus]|uniref:Microcin C transport system substrate-binding protein n=1 Tax=Enhydrobacter aerosaccus TaxID=225324 RepID=A0A1T4QEL6_9HYPH|nr:extracellular solute-binding protein [Enhydrobacter aerosaccus]SKA02144.1 microcin C transport system substrate-binding protein [Enhydrobacter aerosaccus]